MRNYCVVSTCDQRPAHKPCSPARPPRSVVKKGATLAPDWSRLSAQPPPLLVDVGKPVPEHSGIDDPPVLKHLRSTHTTPASKRAFTGNHGAETVHGFFILPDLYQNNPLA